MSDFKRCLARAVLALAPPQVGDSVGHLLPDDVPDDHTAVEKARETLLLLCARARMVKLPPVLDIRRRVVFMKALDEMQWLLADPMPHAEQ